MASKVNDVKGFKTYQAKKIVDDRQNVFISVGRTTKWDNNNPELVPDVQKGTPVEEIVGFKRADQVEFVVPDENGTIEQLGQTWRIVDLEEARELDCRWVYVSAWLMYDRFPVVVYRQTGVHIEVVTDETVTSNQQIVLPNNVTDTGYLTVVNNRSPVTRESTQKELVEFIIEL